MIDLRKLADILQPPDRFLGHETGGQTEGLPTYNPVIPPPDPRANDIVAPNGSQPDLSRFQPVQPATIAPVEQGRPLLAMPPPTGGLVYDTTSTPTEPEAMPPRIVVSPARRTQSEIDQIETKDYSKRPNPNYDPTKPATTRHTKTGDTNNKYVYGKDYDRSRGFKDFLRSAGLGALGGFLRGGIGGAIGGAAAGGIRGAINPNTDNQMLDQMKLEQLYPRYQRQFETETARQQADQTAQLRGQQVAGETAETYIKRLKAIQQQNPAFLEALWKKGFIDKADQQAAAQLGFGYLPEGNWIKNVFKYDDAGNLVYSPEQGKPNFQPTGITDRKEATVMEDGLPMTGAQAGSQRTQKLLANTREVNDMAVKNAELFRSYLNDNFNRQRQYQTDVTNILSKQADLLTKLNKGDTSQDADLHKELADLQWSIQDANDKYTKSANEAEASTYKGQFDTLYSQMEDVQQRMANRIRQRAGGDAEIRGILSQLKIPKRPKWQKFEPVNVATVPTSTGQTTESAARSYLSSKGLKGKALEDAVRAAKAAGEIY